MSTTDDSDDIVEFSDRTRVAADRGEIGQATDQDRTTVTTDAGDPNNESTRMVAMPEPDDDEPGKTMLIDSPFADPVPPEPAATLVVTEGNDRGRTVALGRESIVAGRALDNGLVMNDPSVSRRHFRIEFHGDGWLVRDLGSGNGTRVNGESMTESRLSEGDVIVAGQTSLVFHSDATADPDRTRAVDLPLPVPQAPAPVRVTAQDVQPPAAPAAIRMQEPPKIRVVSGRTAKSGGGRRAFPVLPAILGAVAFTIILAIAGWFLLRESSPPPSATPAAVAVDSRVEAEERLRMATEAIAQREWDRALGYLDAAAGLQPDLAGIEDARNRARDEKRHASFLGAARKSIEAGSLDEAVGLLGSIGESSVYHKEARELGESLQTAAIQEEVKAVRSLVDAGSHAQARDALVLLLQEHPESADVIALKADMEKAGIIREPRAAPAASPSPPRQAAPSKGSRADLKTALAGYRSGDFSQSSAALRELGGRLRGGDADKAISLADHVDRFGASLTSGREALAGKRLDRAEQDLMQALRLDREIESHYQASIREMLGDTFRGRAAQALQNADYAKARLSATRAMSYRPDDERSRQILDRCEAVARGLFDEARSAASAGRRDEARDKARQVMNILGDHPLSEQARAFIQ